jgi:hypothetical protein
MYPGILDLQDTDNDPRAHLRRGSEPVGGANIFFPHGFLKCSLDCWCDSAPLPLNRCAHPIGVSCQSITADKRAIVAVLRWQGPVTAQQASWVLRQSLSQSCRAQCIISVEHLTSSGYRLNDPCQLTGGPQAPLSVLG